MNWCILIPLLVGAICALLGYLLGKLLGGGDHDDYSNKIGKLQTELDACKLSKISLEGDLKSAKASLASSLASTSVALLPFDAAAAKAVFGKSIKENDLTVVEGIGPKIQELFHNHDVKTWKALSECTVDKCQSVLDSGGERFKIHNPGTWPEQAKMAYEGNWKALLKWQDELDGGK
ncbi:hypothetical protein [uncultured Algibacter sp.]|uniref:hypothetical protein n=1 Tax=uncultured Algibacter sp. TaxID=298659 RepID=UPI002601C668|nr:hypothetical protein [uncultured Algibacter sp.]